MHFSIDFSPYNVVYIPIYLSIIYSRLNNSPQNHLINFLLIKNNLENSATPEIRWFDNFLLFLFSGSIINMDENWAATDSIDIYVKFIQILKIAGNQFEFFWGDMVMILAAQLSQPIRSLQNFEQIV